MAIDPLENLVQPVLSTPVEEVDPLEALMPEAEVNKRLEASRKKTAAKLKKSESKGRAAEQQAATGESRFEAAITESSEKEPFSWKSKEEYRQQSLNVPTADYDAEEHRAYNLPLEQETPATVEGALSRQVSSPGSTEAEVGFQFEPSEDPEVRGYQRTFSDLDKVLSKKDRAYKAKTPEQRLEYLKTVQEKAFVNASGKGERYGKDEQATGSALDYQTSLGAPKLSPDEQLFFTSLRRNLNQEFATQREEGEDENAARVRAIGTTNAMLGTPSWWQDQETTNQELSKPPETESFLGIGVTRLPGGSTIETTPAYLMRGVNSPVNFVAGVVGAQAAKPLSSIKKQRADAGVTETGLIKSGLQNVALNRGFMDEYYDIAKGLGASESMAQTAKWAGLGTDLLMPIVPGSGTLAKGIEGGLEARKAGKALASISSGAAKLSKADYARAIIGKAFGNVLPSQQGRGVYLVAADRLAETIDAVNTLNKGVSTTPLAVDLVGEATRLVGADHPLTQLLSKAKDPTQTLANLAQGSETGKALDLLAQGQDGMARGSKVVGPAWLYTVEALKGKIPLPVAPSLKEVQSFLSEPAVKEAFIGALSAREAAKETARMLQLPGAMVMLTKNTAAATPAVAESIINAAKATDVGQALPKAQAKLREITTTVENVAKELKDKNGKWVPNAEERLTTAIESSVDELAEILKPVVRALDSWGTRVDLGDLEKYAPTGQTVGEAAGQLAVDLTTLGTEVGKKIVGGSGDTNLAQALLRNLVDLHIDDVALTPTGKTQALDVNRMRAEAQQVIRTPPELRGNYLWNRISGYAGSLLRKDVGAVQRGTTGATSEIMTKAVQAQKKSYADLFNRIIESKKSGNSLQEAVVEAVFDPKRMDSWLENRASVGTKQGEEATQEILDALLDTATVAGPRSWTIGGNWLPTLSPRTSTLALGRAKDQLQAWVTKNNIIQTLVGGITPTKTKAVQDYLAEVNRLFTPLGYRVGTFTTPEAMEALTIAGIDHLNRNIAKEALGQVAREEGVWVSGDLVKKAAQAGGFTKPLGILAIKNAAEKAALVVAKRIDSGKPAETLAVLSDELQKVKGFVPEPNTLADLSRSVEETAERLVDQAPNLWTDAAKSWNQKLLRDFLAGKVEPAALTMDSDLLEVLEQELKRAGAQGPARQRISMRIRAAEGSPAERAVFRSVEKVHNALKAFASFRYGAMLSLRPRFHGVNFLTAPLILHATLGGTAIPGTVKAQAQAQMRKFLAMVKEGKGSNPVVVKAPSGLEYTKRDVDELLDAGGISDLPPQGMQINGESVTDLIGRVAKIAKPSGAWSKVKTFVPDATRAITSAPGKLGQLSDSFWRRGVVMDALGKGETTEVALRKGKEALYDYSKMSSLERDTVASYILFYSFLRSSLANAIQNLVAEPSRVSKQVRLAKGTRATGEEGENPEIDRLYIPSSMASRGILSLTEGIDKARYATLMPNLPLVDATLMLVSIVNFPPDLTKFGERLDPTIATALRMAGLESKSSKEQEKMVLENGYFDPRHVALLKGTGLWPVFLAYLGVENENEIAREPKEGETSFQGRYYTLKRGETKGRVVNKEAAKRYLKLVRASQLLGTDLVLKDWTSSFATVLDQAGLLDGIELGIELKQTPSEFVGATTDVRLSSPEEIALRHAQRQERELRALRPDPKFKPVTGGNADEP